jgi:heptose I phosphotransferase
MARARQRFLIVPSEEPVLRRNRLDSLEALFAYQQGDSLYKTGLPSWRERIRVELSNGEQRRVFYLKRYRNPPMTSRLAVLRSCTGARSLAGVEWEWMQRLQADGIAAVTPVAFGEELDGNRERRSAVISLAVPGRSLEHIVADPPPSRAERLRLAWAVAELVARFHRAGYVHRDLYLSHIFHDSKAPMDRSLRLIDLQRVLRPRWWPQRWLVKDLAALNYSVPQSWLRDRDRLRWLLHYLGIDRLDAKARRLVFLVSAKSNQIAKHDRRRHRRSLPRMVPDATAGAHETT